MPDQFPVVTRLISGKGVIKIPEDWGSALQILLYTQVVRPPKNQSLNKTFNPDKSFYAHICFCIDESVLFSLDVNFAMQVFEVHESQASQNLLSLICAYDGILDSFVEVGQVIGVVLSRTNLIKSHPYLRFKPDTIRFECYADTALQLTLKGTRLEKCNFEDGSSVAPPPPPPPTPTVPPGTPVDVDPPYDGDQDGGDTIPFPIDDMPVDPPPTEDCAVYEVAYSWNRFGVPRNATIRLYGPIGGISIQNISPTNATSRVRIECRGLTVSGPCDVYKPWDVETEGNPDVYSDATIVSITAI
jgi:hypothetical protein